MKKNLHKEVYAPGAKPHFLDYINLRNISSAQMKDNNVSVFVGIFKSDQLLNIEEVGNVRGFLGTKTKNTGRIQLQIS